MYGVLYSKKNCTKVAQMRNILKSHGVSFTEAVIGDDVITEDVAALYPQFNENTVVAINGAFVGGYSELLGWAKHRPTYLAG